MPLPATPAAGAAPPPPASGHIPVLAEEAVAQLLTDPQGIYVDATFGRGGHARRILERLGPQGRLIALDRDPAARAAAQSWTDARFEFVHGEFSALAQVLAQRGIARIDGILLDLGVSSPQFDEAQRGFSLRADGPLDMRMNTERGPTAAEWLEQVGEDQLKQVLRDYGDERFAASIAKALVARRAAGQPVRRTAELAAVVAGAVPVRNRKDPLQHPATRTFQAVRIFLNQELEEVAMILPAALAALRPGGRLAVISFHSLEDRIVKRFFAAHARPQSAFGRLPLREADLPRPRLNVLARIEAGAAELAANPRARSAHLRVAERTDVPWEAAS
jgi:16S rRNA (cytosine1402-N4)-methyltransferase